MGFIFEMAVWAHSGRAGAGSLSVDGRLSRAERDASDARQGRAAD